MAPARVQATERPASQRDTRAVTVRVDAERSAVRCDTVRVMVPSCSHSSVLFVPVRAAVDRRTRRSRRELSHALRRCNGPAPRTSPHAPVLPTEYRNCDEEEEHSDAPLGSI
ncbi:Hypothetical protein SMAX5B_018321 [Scophthalmus maximus]|uniref:Uncharacterized protein n=1 Tax=Scophthalmus maximus TaxID=52904 RepID=A0A2U9CAG8_SCOMX|nr:Hypothetical protein SMAX5B_018321 [Scophthalmus maximus]